MSEITELEPGKCYRVTSVVEGVADAKGSIDLGALNEVYRARSGLNRDRLMMYAPVTQVEEIDDPGIQPGRFYRDADYEVFLRLNVNGNDMPWLSFGTESAGEFDGPFTEDFPTRPLIELELKEKTT